jgi:DNA-binding transcriptional ArsR family regulator
METTLPSQMVVWLRAAGEPSRLRLLALCGEGALTVSDLAQAMRQSEPRVSRHLKILCEAGLLVRTREGQWVRYGLCADAGAVSFVRGLLLQVDRRHPLLARDRAEARAAQALEPQGSPPGSQPRLERALRAFVESSGFGQPASLLMVGAAHLELLARAPVSTVLAPSRRAAQAVRSFAEARGLNCRVLAAARPGEFGEQDFARAGGPFDAVLCNPPGGSEELLGRLLAQLAPRVAPGGHLWIFQRYESLENAHARIVEHPLARLRRLLGESKLSCERLSPIEADGEHLLAAAARPAGAAEAAADAAPRAGSGR